MQTKHLCVFIHIWTKGEVGAPLNRFKLSSIIFYWLFQGGTSFVDLLWVFSVLCLLCLCTIAFIMFINVKMPTIVDILTFISMINKLSVWEFKSNKYSLNMFKLSTMF